MFLTNLCLSKTMLSNWYLVCTLSEAVFVFEYINWFLVMLERRSRLANTLKVSCKDAKVDVIYPDLSVAVFSAISVNWLVNVQWDTWIGRQHFLVLTMSVTWAELKWSLQTWERKYWQFPPVISRWQCECSPVQIQQSDFCCTTVTWTVWITAHYSFDI